MDTTTLRVVRPDDTVDTLIDTVQAVLDRLAAGNAEREEPSELIAVPADRDAVAGWVREVWTDRGGRLRQRKSLRTPTDEASALASMIRWHRGLTGGHLMGPMMHRMTLGAQRYDEVDTVALAVIAAGTGRVASAGAEAWRRVLGTGVAS